MCVKPYANFFLFILFCIFILTGGLALERGLSALLKVRGKSTTGKQSVAIPLRNPSTGTSISVALFVRA